MAHTYVQIGRTAPGSPAPHFFQHPSSVSALRADPPSPTRGEGRGALLNTSPEHTARAAAPGARILD
ncbi:MAG: hypothetical protein E5Y14_27890 [Mesorhizobium sp.]|nr:MAG: hypothetical protein E5Y14_27890 [Mesorhizobium sp.]